MSGGGVNLSPGVDATGMGGSGTGTGNLVSSSGSGSGSNSVAAGFSFQISEVKYFGPTLTQHRTPARKIVVSPHRHEWSYTLRSRTVGDRNEPEVHLRFNEIVGISFSLDVTRPAECVIALRQPPQLPFEPHHTGTPRPPAAPGAGVVVAAAPASVDSKDHPIPPAPSQLRSVMVVGWVWWLLTAILIRCVSPLPAYLLSSPVVWAYLSIITVCWHPIFRLELYLCGLLVAAAGLVHFIWKWWSFHDAFSRVPDVHRCMYVGFVFSPPYYFDFMSLRSLVVSRTPLSLIAQPPLTTIRSTPVTGTVRSAFPASVVRTPSALGTPILTGAIDNTTLQSLAARAARDVTASGSKVFTESDFESDSDSGTDSKRASLTHRRPHGRVTASAVQTIQSTPKDHGSSGGGGAVASVVSPSTFLQPASIFATTPTPSDSILTGSPALSAVSPPPSLVTALSFSSPLAPPLPRAVTTPHVTPSSSAADLFAPPPVRSTEVIAANRGVVGRPRVKRHTQNMPGLSELTRESVFLDSVYADWCVRMLMCTPLLYNSWIVRRVATIFIPILYLYQALDALFGGLLPIVLRFATYITGVCAPEYAVLSSIVHFLVAPFPWLVRIVWPFVQWWTSGLLSLLQATVRFIFWVLTPIRWINSLLRAILHFVFDEMRGWSAYRFLSTFHREISLLLNRLGIVGQSLIVPLRLLRGLVVTPVIAVYETVFVGFIFRILPILQQAVMTVLDLFSRVFEKLTLRTIFPFLPSRFSSLSELQSSLSGASSLSQLAEVVEPGPVPTLASLAVHQRMWKFISSAVRMGTQLYTAKEKALKHRLPSDGTAATASVTATAGSGGGGGGGGGADAALIEPATPQPLSAYVPFTPTERGRPPSPPTRSFESTPSTALPIPEVGVQPINGRESDPPLVSLPAATAGDIIPVKLTPVRAISLPTPESQTAPRPKPPTLNLYEPEPLSPFTPTPVPVPPLVPAPIPIAAASHANGGGSVRAAGSHQRRRVSAAAVDTKSSPAAMEDVTADGAVSTPALTAAGPFKLQKLRHSKRLADQKRPARTVPETVAGADTAAAAEGEDETSDSKLLTRRRKRKR